MHQRITPAAITWVHLAMADRKNEITRSKKNCDKARNEQQKSVLLSDVAGLFADHSSELCKQSKELTAKSTSIYKQSQKLRARDDIPHKEHGPTNAEGSARSKSETTLRIGKAQLDELRRHGEETYPTECCGVLVGSIDGDGRKFVTSAIRCRNTREDSPTTRYEIDPRELLRIQRECRNTGGEIVGFYHSHPDHPPRWSRTDLAEAHWTGCSYVIASIEHGCATETASFTLLGDEETKSFLAETIEIF